MPGIRKMMKLIEALRKRRLQMQHDESPTKREIWNPVSRESSGRRISAPSYSLCGATDIGKRRRKNEDEYYLSPDCKLWIVADGMGGHAAGDVASALTIQAIAESMDPSGPNAFSDAEAGIGDRLVEAFTAAQNRVSDRSLSEPECNGMGNCHRRVCGRRGSLCPCRDVQGYHFSEGLTRLTNDHSLVWELVTSGQLTPIRLDCTRRDRK
jgi:serine/threonine protein phosphatase PrpC